MRFTIFALLVSSAAAAEGAGYKVTDMELSDVSETGTVTYTCLLRNMWTAGNHPADYPLGTTPGTGAHWSPSVWAAHNTVGAMWMAGAMASTGVQTVAEGGNPMPLNLELDALTGVVGSRIQGPGPFFNNQFTFQVADGELMMSPTYPYLSSISMIADSPDWFSGVNSYDMRSEGKWIKSIRISTDPYDAGTADGVTYDTSVTGRPVTTPRGNITLFKLDNVPGNIFKNSDMTDVLPVASFECTMASVVDPGTDDDDCEHHLFGSGCK